MLRSHARALRDEARATDQRRLLVCAGERVPSFSTALDAVDAVAGPDDRVTVVSAREDTDPPGEPGDRVPPERAASLLGTTRDVVVLDCGADFSPTLLGQVAGCVAGGGLLVLATPPLAGWPRRRSRFHEGLAPPPHDVADVTGHFRRRLARTLRAHPGVSVYDAASETVAVDGLTGETETPARPRVSDPPADAVFPAAAHEACLTADQRRAVRLLERLSTAGTDGPRAVVLEADRGRGKSAAAGLAAASLALGGHDVAVTAPERPGASELFARARHLVAGSEGTGVETVRTDAGGRVRFVPPATLDDAACAAADAVVVDEAAGLPVARLAETLTASAVAYVTTVHGYEGTGRGFDVRFRDRLAASDHAVDEVRLDEPVRHAPDDPVERWVFDALLLDARPAVDEAVADAAPETVTYERPTSGELVADDARLRETFGLLALAHYRTEPDDLARLLDAPNVRVRTMVYDGRVVAVALLAREGSLDAETRSRAYEGERVRGNMVPDLLTSQLRDEDAGSPVGDRVLRVAVHGAVRLRGIGSALLRAVEREVGSEVDWLGVGFGATPRLCRFWADNGYESVHLSTTRNDRSGEYSAVMLRPTSAAGRALADRHGARFARRAPDVLAGPLRDADPDVVRVVLGATPADPTTDLTDHEWRVVAAAAFGPGLYDAAPGAFARLARAALVDGGCGLDDRDERLLVAAALQRRPWPDVAETLGYETRRAATRAFGDAYRPIVDRYGGAAAAREADRYR